MKSSYGLEDRNVSDLELVIIGGGAAGLSAAIYASLMGINHVIIEAESGGGLMNMAKTVENFPGVMGKRGPDITASLLDQLKNSGGKLNAQEPAQQISLDPSDFAIGTNVKTYRPSAVIIASGLELIGLGEEFGLPDERDYLGRGLSYCAECDGPLFKGKRVMVIGNPFDAFLLKRLTDDVIYLGPVPEEYQSQVPREIIEASEIQYLVGKPERLIGDSALRGILVDGQRHDIEGLFITRRKAGSEIFRKAGLDLDENEFIVTDRHMATSIEGVFAAGDMTGEPWQIAKSVGEGAVAALSVFKYLTGQEMRNLGWALQDELQYDAPGERIV